MKKIAISDSTRERANTIVNLFRSGQISDVYAKTMLTALGCEFHLADQHQWVAEYFENAFTNYKNSKGKSQYLFSPDSSGSILRFFDDPEDEDIGQQFEIKLHLTFTSNDYPITPEILSNDVTSILLEATHGPTFVAVVSCEDLGIG